jgi:hypothetical protein
LQLRNEEDLIGFPIELGQQFAGLAVFAEGNGPKASRSKIAEMCFSACKGRYVVWIEFMATIASAVHNEVDVHDEPPTEVGAPANQR